MLPRMWRIDACMNMLVKTVSQAGIVSGTCPRPHASSVAFGTWSNVQWAAGMGQRVRDRAVLDDLVHVGAADDRAPVADRQEVDDEVRDDQPERHEREPIRRDVVLDRDHAPRRLSCPGARARADGPLEPCWAALKPRRRSDRDDPPRLRGVAVERERPVLGEDRRPRAAARQHLGGVAVLDVAASLHVHLDAIVGGTAAASRLHDSDLLDPRAAYDQPVDRDSRDAAAPRPRRDRRSRAAPRRRHRPPLPRRRPRGGRRPRAHRERSGRQRGSGRARRRVRRLRS